MDGDLLVYRCGFSVEKTLYLLIEDGLEQEFKNKTLLNEYIDLVGLEESQYEVKKVQSLEPLSHAYKNIREILKSIEKGTGCDSMTIYLTGKGNFRDEVATLKPYKGNRDKVKKPEYYEALRQYLIKEYGAVVVEGEEADDAMGIEQTRLMSYNYNEAPIGESIVPIIASVDKDMHMIPGWHYNFVKDLKFFVDEDTADLWFWCQMIMGDTTDNIGGVPKAGKKAAYNLLSGVDPCRRYPVVREAYEKAYGDNCDEALTENARLLWIRRETEELWSPETHAFKFNYEYRDQPNGTD